MQALRRVNCSSKRFLANAKITNAARFSSFSERERGEESKYFKHLDETKKAEMRAQVEAILAASDGDKHKEELHEVLAAHKGEEKKGLLAKFRLNDWKIALPVGIIAAIPMIEKEVIILNEEVYVGVGFFFFVSGIYHYAGPSIAKFFDDYSNDIGTKLKGAEEGLLQQINDDIASNKAVLSIAEDTAAVHALVDGLAAVQAEVLTAEAEHIYREAITKKLDTLAVLEESASAAIRRRMLNAVQDDVLATFKNDKKAKEAALAQAVAVLTAGNNAKLGEDVVGRIFSTSVKNYRESYAKQPEGADEIISKLERDIANVIKAPSVDVMGKGGNVYETHPVAARFMA